ncbi:30S ribosomal protein S21 [Gracilariopsis chorda]|uniref:30S ribosomal protein S21 n=1 Tax=Gracilariopsis chorda TaxID=448386 RepID=A0A2V3J354_9FLOR|nr:30S ribosomal protein S21 [Gracilariopsis chorda]|eukprot:PXF48809.1 30S ribosomal protein S21 [Gracilariopsis chorda]
MAFGAPLPARIPPPPAASNVRMEVTVIIGDSEPIEGALRRFKKEVTKSGHLFELRRRRYFETNTERRIRKAAAAKRKAKLSRNTYFPQRNKK